MGLTARSRERKQKSERICIEKRSDRNRPPQIIRGVPAPVVADRAVRADRWRRRSRFPCRAVRRVILESVKKLEELFIAPTARQILHETAQRAFARCECA